MATRMQQRRGTAQQWTDADPILAAGEIGFETDTNQFKIGDGVNAWSDLSYFKNLEDLGGSLDDYVLISTKGQANGVAELDNTGKIPSSQIPALVGLDTEITSAVSAAVADLVDGAPGALDTLNEISEVLGNPSNITGNIINNLSQLDTSVNELGTTVVGHTTTISTLQTTVSGHTTSLATNTTAIGDVSDRLDSHSSDSTDVHGIANTADLATKTYADGAAASVADSKIATHNADTTDVHGISNTANLVYTSDSRLSDERTPSAGSVTAEKIAADAVETAKIKDLNVTTGKIADSAITSAKIADATIVNGDISATAAIAQSKISGLTSDLSAKLDSATAATTYAPIASPTFTGTVAGITKSMVGLANVDNTSDANKPVSTATQTALDAKLALAGGTMTGALTLSGDPTSALHAVTKQYADGLAAGINFHQPVVAATTGNLAGVYDNGTNGLGATLTASANGAIGTIDGATVSVGSRILLRAQTDATQNGIYTVTNVGGASAKWVVTRATDADNNPSGELATGDFCFVTSGSTNASKGFILSTTGTITVGTTNVNYSQFNASEAVTAGTNITKSGSTISVADAPTFSGAITASSGVVFSDGTQTKEAVPSRTTIQQKTASYTLSALTERDNMIEISSTSGTTLTIPTNATLALPVGTSIDILQTNTGQVTIAGAAGVTVNGTPGLKLRTQWSSATLFKRATDTWVVMGDLSA